MKDISNLEMIKIQSSIKKKTTAWLLFIFLGGFGAHCFYIGKTWVGALMVTLSISAFVMFTVDINVALLCYFAYFLVWFVSIFIINPIVNNHNNNIFKDIENKNK